MTIPTVTWVQVSSTDVPATQAFYGKLFGWTFGDSPYSEIRAGDKPIGGVAPADENYAMFYVEVSDVDDACARAVELGGRVLVPVSSDDDGLRFAHLADRAGNRFGVFSNEPASPAPE
jgi:uncharacterized protein